MEVVARGGDREGRSELSCEACIVSPSVSGDSNASDARVALRLGTLRRLRLGSWTREGLVQVEALGVAAGLFLEADRPGRNVSKSWKGRAGSGSDSDCVVCPTLSSLWCWSRRSCIMSGAGAVAREVERCVADDLVSGPEVVFEEALAARVVGAVVLAGLVEEMSG